MYRPKFQTNEVIESFFGYDYSYRTHTDDENKYKTKKNKRFIKMAPDRRKKYIKVLWRKTYNKALVCGVMIQQFHIINTKLSYFGRQVIHKNNLQTDGRLRVRMHTGNPKWIPCLLYSEDTFKKYWDYLQIWLLLYTLTLEPYIVSFYAVEDRYAIFQSLRMYIDLLLTIDIFFSFLSPFERFDGTFEGNIKKIAKHYIRS